MVSHHADWMHKPWRYGGQVGRTLYVDQGAGEKDPTLLFGLVDSPDIAAHIVRIHNWWLNMTLDAEKIWGRHDGDVSP